MRYLGEGHVAPWRKSCGSTPVLRAISRLRLPMLISGALIRTPRKLPAALVGRATSG
jgi:hypothetical protein